MKTRVAVIDDHVLIRQMLALLLPREGPYEIVGEAGTGFEAVKLCRREKPRIMILDLLLPEMDGIEVLRMVREEARETRFVFYSGAVCGELIADALQSQPHGFVHKTEEWSTFREALRVVAAGGIYLTPVARRIVDQRRGEPQLRGSPTLRERLVLQMIAAGAGNKQIANRLSLSAKTVGHRRAQVIDKWDLRNVAATPYVADGFPSTNRFHVKRG